MTTRITNIAAYLFVAIDDIGALRERWQGRCDALGLRGTILLAPEGVNVFLAGESAAVEIFLSEIRQDARFSRLTAKYSWSDSQPFKRMRVKQKKEIITMKRPLVRPQEGRAPAVDALTLSRWLDAGKDDENRPVILMDTRNAFEVDLGSFENALDYRIERFSEFPDKVEQVARQFDGKTVVTFCTGGIRCEKAAIVMKEAGYERVYQLDGGILKYFEEAGQQHYRGTCFVFDERESLDPTLQATAAAVR
jgi:UPF0176 protein